MSDWAETQTERRWSDSVFYMHEVKLEDGFFDGNFVKIELCLYERCTFVECSFVPSNCLFVNCIFVKCDNLPGRMTRFESKII